MTELYSFLDGAFADMRARLDQEYQRRMTAHATALTSEVSAIHYTPNYGKIDVEKAFLYFHEQLCGCRHSPPSLRPERPSAVTVTGYVQTMLPSGQMGGCTKQYTTAMAHLTTVLPSDAWVVHAIYECRSSWGQYDGSNWRETRYYTVSLYDNFGSQYNYGLATSTTYTGCHSFFAFNYADPIVTTSVKRKPYALSNHLIDFCKSFKTDPYKERATEYSNSSSTWGKEISLQTLAERDYKQAALLKLYKSPAGCPDYLTLKCEKERLEQLLATTQKQLADAHAQITELETQRKKEEPVFPELLISELSPPSPPSPLDPAILSELESILTHS